MVSYHKGDLLKTNAQLILHQVNLQGIMGGGLALSIAKKYPNVELVYRTFEHKELGQVVFAMAGNKYIGNCFSQNEDFTTNYDALRECLYKVIKFMNKFDIKTVAIPYKYGCGIANGNWSIIEQIFKYFFEQEKDIDFQIWEYKGE